MAQLPVRIFYKMPGYLLFLLILLISGCAGEASIGVKVGETLSGSAYDAVTSNTETYNGVGTSADGLSEAQSYAASAGELAGRVHAECTDPTSNQLDGDQALARSNNQVRSRFTIAKKGDLTFRINLKVEGEQITHGDSISITVLANILSSNGAGIQQGGITRSSFTIKPQPTGSDSVFIRRYHYQGNRSVEESKAIDSNGSFDYSFDAGVDEHPALPPGNYQLEFALRVYAYAAVQVGADGKTYLAKVDKVTGTITMK